MKISINSFFFGLLWAFFLHQTVGATTGKSTTGKSTTGSSKGGKSSASKSSSARRGQDESTAASCQGVVEFRFLDAPTLIQQGLDQINVASAVWTSLNASALELTFPIANVLAPPYCELVELMDDEDWQRVRDLSTSANATTTTTAAAAGRNGWVDAVKSFARVYQDNLNEANIEQRRQGWKSSGGGIPLDPSYWDTDEPKLVDVSNNNVQDHIETAAVYVPDRQALQSAAPNQGQNGAYYKCCYDISIQDITKRTKSDLLRKALAGAQSHGTTA